MSTCHRCSVPCLDDSTLCPTCSSIHDMAHGLPATPSPDKALEAPQVAKGPQRHVETKETGRFKAGEILAERYRVIQALGRGAMGEVYQADDLELGDVVALKFLPAELERDRRRLTMLLDEVRIARTVSHPNVCRVHDIGIHRDEPAGELHFVCMEYIDGEDLAKLLRRIGRFPKAKALEVAHQLCAGLAAIHAAGLLHRDIKPSNVMIDGLGHVRLTDFGLAIDAADASGLAGTPAYMAPEQHTMRSATIRSEVYALGLVLYEIFTGERAFTAQSPQEYAWRHLQYQPEAPSSRVENLHPEIERVLLSCLEKISAHRPPSAEAVAEALNQIDSEGSTAATGAVDQGDVLRTLLVCDLVGSTALVERLGDRRAAELGVRHDRLARDLLTHHMGREIDKTDGFLLLFERPIQALRFALDYHEALGELSLEEDCELASRVGIHFGEVWLRENPPADIRRGAKPIEVEGLAKAVTARLMSLAAGKQTLLSQGAFDLARRAAVGLEEAHDLRWLDHGAWRLHGVADPVDVYEVGREGKAPLEAPAESEKVRRLLIQPRVEGWRPAPGLSVPGRPHWQVEERLGVGGFGEAWRVRHTKTDEPRCFKFCFDAERLRSLQREITLFRLLKEELGERRDINRLLDWNLDQAPYFIESEYTRDGDLAQWAEVEGGLTQVPLATRLEIVAQVADALAAAHSVGVLHKDVKPSNVLIQKVADGNLQAQLADFGVGQATQQERLAAAGITVLGLSRSTQGETSSSQTGTQLYMAPELLEGRTPTLQADIYALGVMLYQVVVGDFRRALAQGWKRQVEDPLLADDIAALVDGSPERRPADASEVAERLRGLEARRQEHQIAEANQRAQEVSRRRRQIYKAVAVTSLVALVAVSVLAIGLFQAGREERQARKTTEKVLDFMVGVFEITDPYSEGEPGEKRGQNITAREILDRGAERVETEFVDEPLVQTRLMNTYGDIYRSLGIYDRAQELHDAAFDVAQQRLGAEHPSTLAAMHGQGATLFSRGEYAQSKDLLEQTLELRKQILGPEHPDTLETMASLAGSLWKLAKVKEAKQIHEHILETRSRVLGAEHPSTLSTMAQLAAILGDQADRLSHRPEVSGEHEEAKRLSEQVLEIQTRVLGAEHPSTLSTMSDLARLLLIMGEDAEFKRISEQILETQIQALGAEHPSTLSTMRNLAISLSVEGEHLESKRLNEQILEVQTRVLGAEHPNTSETMGILASNLSSLGEYLEEKRLREPLVEIHTSVYGAENPLTLLARDSLVNTLSRLGEYAEARRLEEQTWETRSRILGPEHPHTLRRTGTLSKVLSGLGEYTEAKRLNEEVLEIQARVLGPEHPTTLWLMNNLASSLSDLGEHSQALELLEKCLKLRKRVLGEDHSSTLYSMHTAAIVLRRQGKLEEAEILQQEVLETVKRSSGEKHRLFLLSMRSLGETLFLRSEWSRARRLQEEALEAHQHGRGSDHLDTQEVRIQLAKTLRQLDELERAKQLAQEAAEKLEAKLGPRHYLTSQAAKELLEIALQEGDPAAILVWIEKLRWLTEADEESIDSVKLRDIRRDVLEVLRKLDS